jgi:hypothetical protein
MDKIIPPEILNDDFHAALKRYAALPNLKTFLEIGSSSGAGSTDAFVSGIKQRRDQEDVRLFCMEVSRARYKVLSQYYENHGFVRCYNISSVETKDFPSQNEVINFYNTTNTILNGYSIETVLGWLADDIRYVEDSGSNANGIALIKRANNIVDFDMVLIDGSEFTGERELYSLIGAKIIALDDVNSFKCWNAYQILFNTSHYDLREHNLSLRGGYAFFEKKFSTF